MRESDGAKRIHPKGDDRVNVRRQHSRSDSAPARQFVHRQPAIDLTLCNSASDDDDNASAGQSDSDDDGDPPTQRSSATGSFQHQRKASQGPCVPCCLALFSREVWPTLEEWPKKSLLVKSMMRQALVTNHHHHRIVLDAVPLCDTRVVLTTTSSRFASRVRRIRMNQATIYMDMKVSHRPKVKVTPFWLG